MVSPKPTFIIIQEFHSESIERKINFNVTLPLFSIYHISKLILALALLLLTLELLINLSIVIDGIDG